MYASCCTTSARMRWFLAALQNCAYSAVFAVIKVCVFLVFLTHYWSGSHLYPAWCCSCRLWAFFTYFLLRKCDDQGVFCLRSWSWIINWIFLMLFISYMVYGFPSNDISMWYRTTEVMSRVFSSIIPRMHLMHMYANVCMHVCTLTQRKNIHACM